MKYLTLVAILAVSTPAIADQSFLCTHTEDKDINIILTEQSSNWSETMFIDGEQLKSNELEVIAKNDTHTVLGNHTQSFIIENSKNRFEMLETLVVDRIASSFTHKCVKQ